MDFIGISSYTELLEIVSRSDTTEIEEKIKSYILDMVNRNFSTSYMKVFIASVSHFYEWNDIENIRWRKLKRFMGEKTPNTKIGVIRMKKYRLYLTILTSN